MKYIAGFMMLAFALTAAGCAEKSASEQLKDDMNKAAKRMDKEVKGFLK